MKTRTLPKPVTTEEGDEIKHALFVTDGELAILRNMLGHTRGKALYIAYSHTLYVRHIQPAFQDIHHYTRKIGLCVSDWEVNDLGS